ncbi:hypothetical protein [Streptomyces sp. NPDC051561]|uniref:beta family protein n=1 Tax=Streptomyces sp. NPDC051561 TaxID=3365658 RepID=UPI0037AC4C99
MAGPIYVPVLPTRRYALWAYEQLDPRIRRRVVPLWTVAPRAGPERMRGVRPDVDLDPDQDELARWFRDRTDKLIGTVRGAAGWVDTGHVECAVEAAAIGLWRLATRSRLRLVTSLDRSPTQQRYTADLAFLSGRGLGLRLLVDTPPAETLPEEVHDLIQRLGVPPSQLDLILDLGMVTDAAEASKRGTATLDLLGELARWRTLILTSGSFPRSPRVSDERFPDRSTDTAPRHDVQVHRSVLDDRPDDARRPVFGDYSAEHAHSANIPTPPKESRGPDWSILRYTTMDDFLLPRVPTRGADHVARTRAKARRIVESPGFRGRGFSAAESWLYECAYGEGSKGSGSAETWAKVGHIQHMTFAVRRLLTERGAWAAPGQG